MQVHSFPQQKNHNLEKPFKEMVDLNTKTMQKFSSINPLDLLNTHNPQELLDRNINLLIQSSHQALDYMQSMFQLMGQHWFGLSEQLREQSQAAMKQTKSTARSTLKKAVKAGEKMTRTVSAHSKNDASHKKTSSHHATSRAKGHATLKGSKNLKQDSC